MPVLDEKAINPAFQSDLKAISKDRSFGYTYTKTIRGYLSDSCKNHAKAKREYIESIGHFALISQTDEFEVSKCRVKYGSFNKSNGARLYYALASEKELAIPLTIYTHRDKQREDPLKLDVLKMLKAVVDNCISSHTSE